MKVSPEIKEGGAALTDEELRDFVQTFRDRGLTGRTFVQSFHPEVFAQVRALDPDLQLVYLSSSVVYVSAVRAAGADIASVRLSAPGAAHVATHHAYGVPIYAWTADTVAEPQRAWSVGVDSVITDVPGTAVALFR